MPASLSCSSATRDSSWRTLLRNARTRRDLVVGIEDQQAVAQLRARRSSMERLGERSISGDGKLERVALRRVLAHRDRRLRDDQRLARPRRRARLGHGARRRRGTLARRAGKRPRARRLRRGARDARRCCGALRLRGSMGPREGAQVRQRDRRVHRNGIAVAERGERRIALAQCRDIRLLRRAVVREDRVGDRFERVADAGDESCDGGGHARRSGRGRGRRMRRASKRARHSGRAGRPAANSQRAIFGDLAGARGHDRERERGLVRVAVRADAQVRALGRALERHARAGKARHRGAGVGGEHEAPGLDRLALVDGHGNAQVEALAQPGADLGLAQRERERAGRREREAGLRRGPLAAAIPYAMSAPIEISLLWAAAGGRAAWTSRRASWQQTSSISRLERSRSASISSSPR